jgi:hypothetical protein
MVILAQKSHDKSDDEDISWGTDYQILKCHSCPEVTVRCHDWHDFMDTDGEPEYRVLYPAESRMPLGMPEKIEKAYRAAIKVKSVDANAFGVLIGRVMDMVCQDRGAVGRFLGQKLDDLAAKGEVPQKLVDVAKKLTKLRNVGAHAELGELTPREVPVVEDLCRALLDYIYTAPHLANRANETLTGLLTKENEEDA